jgi:hypothetical protein
MRTRCLLALLAASAAAALLSACTITRVGSEDGPPRIESDGLIEGHAAVGLRDEDDFFRLRVLDGTSDGALGEIVLWKLFRLEVGALGAGVGIGPFDLALGTLFYGADVPRMQVDDERDAAAPVPDPVHYEEGCEICARARAGSGGQ